MKPIQTLEVIERLQYSRIEQKRERKRRRKTDSFLRPSTQTPPATGLPAPPIADDLPVVVRPGLSQCAF